MSIRLYLASEFEYRRGLANRLLEENIIDFCLTDHLPWTESPEHDERIVEIDHRPSANEEYDLVCNINEFPAVSKDLMEKMLPYESMAIRLGMRRLNHPTTEYEEEKRKYLQHLRYWNYMLDHYKINLIVTHNTPHSQGKYVVYGLAQVKNIPMLIWCKCGTFPERCFWGNSLKTMGASIGQKYLDLTSEQINNFVLEEDIIRGFESAKQAPVKYDRMVYDKRAGSELASFYKESYRSKKKEYYRQYIRSVVRSIIKTGNLRMHHKNDTWFRLCRRHFHAYKYYKKHIEGTLTDYNRLAKNSDILKKYILFLIQVFPEANLIPRAGVFADQYNSIQLLARAAEKADVCVYVKEHPHLAGRSKYFYDEIKSIPNVTMIKTTEYSYDLIQNSNCVGVATQTGTCIWESLAMKKPVLIFGDGYYWKNCPGLFEIVDEDQGGEVIKRLVEGVSIKDEDLYRYLYAIQLETMRDGCSPQEEKKRVFDSNYVVSEFDETERVALIKRFLKEEISVRD